MPVDALQELYKESKNAFLLKPLWHKQGLKAGLFPWKLLEPRASNDGYLRDISLAGASCVTCIHRIM